MSNELSKLAGKAVNAQNTAMRTCGHLGDAAKAAYYAEPFYLAGDIYSNSDHPGRGGWTIYTGAAAWYYTLILCEVFGISFYDTETDRASFEICCDRPVILPELLYGCVLRICPCNSFKCEYSIEFSEGETASVTVDGESVKGRIKAEAGTHRVQVCYPKC